MSDQLTLPQSSGAWQRFGALVAAEMRAHRLIVISAIAFFLAACAVNLALGRPLGMSAWPYFDLILTVMLPTAFVLSLLIVFPYIVIFKRPESPARAMIDVYKPLIADPRRWAKAVPAIFIMMLGFMAFTDLKSAIPLINPFSWDVTFMEWDRALHFGTDPWRLLDPILGHPVPTVTINFVYNLWFLVMFGFWLSAGWTRREAGWERQFLLAFLWCWILGGAVLATLFSSMGPAFYDLIDPANNPFAAQMASLQEIDESHGVLALATQDLLRDAYLNPGAGKVSGISAMPSMHNATSFLFLLAAFRINKRFGYVMTAFFAMILVGSVHLAWHYAVDAYLGIAVAWACWWSAGKALKWQDRKKA